MLRDYTNQRLLGPVKDRYEGTYFDAVLCPKCGRIGREYERSIVHREEMTVYRRPFMVERRPLEACRKTEVL